MLAEYVELIAANRFRSAERLPAERVSQVPAELLAALRTADDPDPDLDQATARRESVGWRHDLEAMAADTEDLARWSAVQQPTLLMQGAETWTPMPQTIDALATALPDVHRVSYPGQVHFAPSTAPDLVAGSIDDFLTAIDRR